MAEAEVGDDVYGEDPTVNRLQERAAEIFEKDAALFVPTGSMGNQTAVKLHTRPGQEVIIEGDVRGDIHATERVEIGNHASVIGNIEAGIISIQPGAVFEGRCVFLSNQRPSDTEVSRSDSVDSSIPQRFQSVRDQDEQQEESFFVAVGR